jgi:hypothetical protein
VIQQLISCAEWVTPFAIACAWSGLGDADQTLQFNG